MFRSACVRFDTTHRDCFRLFTTAGQIAQDPCEEESERIGLRAVNRVHASWRAEFGKDGKWAGVRVTARTLTATQKWPLHAAGRSMCSCGKGGTCDPSSQHDFPAEGEIPRRRGTPESPDDGGGCGRNTATAEIQQGESPRPISIYEINTKLAGLGQQGTTPGNAGRPVKMRKPVERPGTTR